MTSSFSANVNGSLATGATLLFLLHIHYIMNRGIISYKKCGWQNEIPTATEDI